MGKQSRRPNRRNRKQNNMEMPEYLIPYSCEWWDKLTVVNIMQATMANIHARLSGADVNNMICMICGDSEAKDYIVTNNANPELLARLCDDCNEIQQEMHGLETILYDGEITTIQYGEKDIARINLATHYQMRDGRKEKIQSREFCPACGGTIKIDTEHFWGTFGTAHLENGCINDME